MNDQICQLADALCQHGVRALFGVPGSGLSWQLITAMEERGIAFWSVGHEAAGAIMAGAFGRESASLGCSLSIKGPGLANMLPGIVSNWYEQWAALSISEAYEPGGPAFRMHKRLDHQAVTAPVVKAYAGLGDPAWTLAPLADCARREIPGPVHLDLFAEGGACFKERRAAETHTLDFSTKWDRIQRLLRHAGKPVVIAGSLATRCEWGARLGDLQIPVFSTVAAKGVVDEHLPWAAGVFTGDGKALAPESYIVARADLVIGLGLRNLEVLTPKAFTVPLVLLDTVADLSVVLGFDAAEILIPAEPMHFKSLLDGLRAKSWGGEVVSESASSVRRYLTRGEWLPGNVLVTLQALLPDPNCLVVDTGSFCTVAEHLWRAKAHKSFVASANGRYMGTGLPMALGTALANRSRPTICVLGDGGMRTYAAEFKLAVEQKLPILFLFVTDGRYGSIACAPAVPGLSLRAITMRRPSWFEAIRGLGCPSAQVKNVSQLESYVRGWNWTEGPLFLEAVFDPEPYAAMTENIR